MNVEDPNPLRYEQMHHEFLEYYIDILYRKCSGNQTKMAEIAEVNRGTMRKWMKQVGVR